MSRTVVRRTEFHWLKWWCNYTRANQIYIIQGKFNLKLHFLAYHWQHQYLCLRYWRQQTLQLFTCLIGSDYESWKPWNFDIFNSFQGDDTWVSSHCYEPIREDVLRRRSEFCISQLILSAQIHLVFIVLDRTDFDFCVKVEHMIYSWTDFLNISRHWR